MKRKLVFAQYVQIKLVLFQAAWLSIFIGKSVVLHLREGPDQVCTTDRIENRKSPAPGGIQTP